MMDTQGFSETKSLQQDPDPGSTSSIHEFKAIDVREWGLSSYEHYLLASLSGLINREEADLWITWTDHEEKWLDSFDSALFNITTLELEDLSKLGEYYSTVVDGLVIFDDMPESANIGTPLVGLHNALLVHTSLVSTVQSWVGFEDVPVVANLTELYNTQGFTEDTHRAEIYRWAFDTWYVDLNQSALALYDSSNPRHVRSFLSTNKIFTIWQPNMVELDHRPKDDAESLAFFDYMLNSTPKDVIVYGYMFPDGSNEHPVVKALSEHGKYLVPSDWNSNLEFFHALPIPSDFEFRQNRSLPDIELENKIYISGIVSDGDNTQFLAGHFFSAFWNSERRLNNPVPTAYELTPSLYWLAPYLAYTYYSSATIDDYFVPGVGGKGYVKPIYMQPEYFESYHESTWDLMKRMDMQEMRSWDTDFESMIEIMQREDPDSNTELKASYEGYGGSERRRVEMINDVVISHMIYLEIDIEPYISEIQRSRFFVLEPQFIVYHIHCWTIDYAAWAEFVDRVSAYDQVEVVRLDQMTGLIDAYLRNQPLIRTPVLVTLLALGGLAGIIIIVRHLKRKKE